MRSRSTRGDAGSLVADADLGDGTEQLLDLTDGHRHARTVRGIAHGVVDEVAERGHQLARVTHDVHPALASADQVDRAGLGADPAAVHGLDDDLVERDEGRLLERVVALQPGELDDVLHQAGQPVGLVLHAAGEAAHGLGVVGGVDQGLREQRQAADGVLSSWLTLARKSRRTASTRRASVRSSTSSSTRLEPSGATRTHTDIR